MILVYEDHLTTFVQLRPLEEKQVEEVTYHILGIFSFFSTTHLTKCPRLGICGQSYRRNLQNVR